MKSIVNEMQRSVRPEVRGTPDHAEAKCMQVPNIFP